MGCAGAVARFSNLGANNWPLTALFRRKHILKRDAPGAETALCPAAELIRSVNPCLDPTRGDFLLCSVSQRTQILCYWAFPQLRSTEHGVAIPTGHIEFQEGSLSASALE